MKKIISLLSAAACIMLITGCKKIIDNLVPTIPDEPIQTAVGFPTGSIANNGQSINCCEQAGTTAQHSQTVFRDIVRARRTIGAKLVNRAISASGCYSSGPGNTAMIPSPVNLSTVPP